MNAESIPRQHISIVGAGAAGLFAADYLAARGCPVDLYDHKTEPALKLRLAASSGLNFTNSEPPERFAERYGEQAPRFERFLRDDGSAAFIHRARELEIQTFEGSGGKIFAREEDGRTFVNALRQTLSESGRVAFHPGHRFAGFSAEGAVIIANDAGDETLLPFPVILALGGASWPATGSDGTWVEAFRKAGLKTEALKGANCGFDAENFCPDQHAPGGDQRLPIKNVTASFGNKAIRGECMLTRTGIEGGPVYALAAAISSAIEESGSQTVYFDLCPDLDEKKVGDKLLNRKKGESASTLLRKKLRFDEGKLALIRRSLGKNGAAVLSDTPALIKALPVRFLAPRPREEAISCSGGLAFDELDSSLMLISRPGVFCAGEMLDWTAPTGGFLLTACFSTARTAAKGAIRFLGETD